MKFELPKLPYPIDALAPHISAETLEFHHDKHHRAYVEKLNLLIPGTPYTHSSLEEIVLHSDGAVFNNAAQAWNHGFYWNSLSPCRQSQLGNASNQNVSQMFMSQIKSDFGTVEELKQDIKECGMSAFGSGWIWLVRNDLGHLRVINTSNAENPARKQMTPLLVCDVWEHAYSIDYRNERGKYMNAFLELANLEFASQCFVQSAYQDQAKDYSSPFQKKPNLEERGPWTPSS